MLTNIAFISVAGILDLLFDSDQESTVMRAVTLDAAIRQNVLMRDIACGKRELTTWEGFQVGRIWLTAENADHAQELLEAGDLEEFDYHYGDQIADDFVGFIPRQIVMVEYYDGECTFALLGRYILLIVSDGQGYRYKVWQFKMAWLARWRFMHLHATARFISPTKKLRHH